MEKRLTADLNVVANSNLEIQLLDGDLNIIQKLDDEPNDVGGLTSAELKAKFDESGNIIKKYINETLIPAVLTDDATEESRKQAEASRVTAEQGRTSAENSRVEAEAQRAAAEQARADENTGIVAQATAQANAAAGSAESASASAQTAQGAASTASSAAAAASGSASQASASAASAAQSAASVDGVNKTAQSWAVGGTGTRPGEDTDNAKYWAEQAQAVVGGDFATKVEAQGYVTEHNQSDAAHPDLRAAVAGSVRYDAAQSLTGDQKTQARSNIWAAPNGFGLGATDGYPIDPSVEGDLNTAIKCGWYYFGGSGTIANTPSIPDGGYGMLLVSSRSSNDTITQMCFFKTNTTIAIRYRFGSEWQPWEYLNPPMQLDVEYRTTERYLGEPVYCKLVDCGQIADGKTVAHGIDNMSICLSAQGTRGSNPLPRIYHHSLDDEWASYVADVDTTKITLACGTSATGGNCAVVLRYTKTTD